MTAAASRAPTQIRLQRRLPRGSSMACGVGICLGCVVPTHDGLRYVCTHGPVFDPAEVDWEGLA